MRDENGVARVNGIVAVSRAFGNLRLECIVPEPDIKEIDLDGSEDFIVLGCDGLWDVMDAAGTRMFAESFLKKNGGNTKGISEAFVDEALRLGSTDNVSVIFISFLKG